MARPRFKAPSPIFSAADVRAEIRRDERRKLDAEIKKARSCRIAAGEKRAEKQAELAAAKKALREDLSLRRAGRVGAQRGERAEREVRQESDKEVIANLEAEDPRLIPVFKRERRGIKGTRDISRTEAFLEWAQKHPEEIEAVRAASVPSDEEYAAEMAREYGY